MNIQKTTLRTQLASGTLNAIMKISVDGPSIDEFEPLIHVKKWIEKAHGKRHLTGHKASTSKKARVDDDVILFPDE